MGTGRAPAMTFRDLIICRKANEFVLTAYMFTAGLLRVELYGLSLLLRRASVFIAANIAGGFRKHGHARKARFMNTAKGYLEERRYYLILAQDRGYGNTDQAMRSSEEVSRLLGAYARRILTPDFWLLLFP